MSRIELEARVAKCAETFLEIDDWIAALSQDDVFDQNVNDLCLQTHSSLAKLYRIWSARLKETK